jgi:hypothetical protein
MYLLREVRTLTLVKNVSRYTLIEICCVAGLCHVVMMYFLGKRANSVNAFYFIGSILELVFSLPEADVCIAVIVLTDVKP